MHESSISLRTRKPKVQTNPSNQSIAQSELAFNKFKEGVKINSSNIQEKLSELPCDSDKSVENLNQSCDDSQDEDTVINYTNSNEYLSVIQNAADNIFNNSINPFSESTFNKSEQTIQNKFISDPKSSIHNNSVENLVEEYNFKMNNYLTALKNINNFTGKPQDIPLFLATCKLAYDSVAFGILNDAGVVQPVNAITEGAFISALKTKLDGPTYSNLKTKNLNTFAEFETAINEQFRLLRPASKIFSDIAKISQKPGEDTINYINRLDDLCQEYQQTITFMEKVEDEASLIPLIAHINKQLVFNGVNGLLQPMRTIAKSRNFISFEEFSKWAYQQAFE